MAAGSNLYSSYKDTDYCNGVLSDIFYAKELTEYSSLESIKLLFYLDYLFPTTIAGENCFIGGVKVGSGYYYMHKETRLSPFAVRYNAEDFILLNDAGLNTLPYISVQIPTVKWANYTKIKMTVTSAYYSSTTEYGIYYRVRGTTEWIKNQAGYSVNSKTTKNDMRLITGAADHAGVTIEFKGYAINEEGEFQSSVYSFVTDDAIVFQLARPVASLYTIPSDNSINFFLTQTENYELGHIEKVSSARNVQVYGDADMSTFVADGLYNIMYAPKPGETYSGDELGAYNGNKAVVTVSGGIITKWEEGLWSTPSDQKVSVSVAPIYDSVWDTLSGYTITVFNNGGINSLSFPCEVWLWKLASGTGLVASSCMDTIIAPACLAGGSVTETIMESRYGFPVSEDEIAIGILPSSVGDPTIAVGGPALLGKPIQ